MINMNNINLNSPEWCELIFNGKNKDYDTPHYPCLDG